MRTWSSTPWMACLQSMVPSRSRSKLVLLQSLLRSYMFFFLVRNSTLSLYHNNSQITLQLLFSHPKTQLVSATVEVASSTDVEVGGVEKVISTTEEEGVLTINLSRIFKINLHSCSQEFASKFAIGLVTLHSIVSIEWITPIRVVIHLLSWQPWLLHTTLFKRTLGMLILGLQMISHMISLIFPSTQLGIGWQSCWAVLARPV